MNLTEVSFSHVKHVEEGDARQSIAAPHFSLKNQQYLDMTHEISSKWWNPSYF